MIEDRAVRRFSSGVEQRFCKPKVAGSIPATGTITISTDVYRNLKSHLKLHTNMILASIGFYRNLLKSMSKLG
jgi:hypothetical protein